MLQTPFKKKEENINIQIYLRHKKNNEIQTNSYQIKICSQYNKLKLGKLSCHIHANCSDYILCTLLSLAVQTQWDDKQQILRLGAS